LSTGRGAKSSTLMPRRLSWCPLYEPTFRGSRRHAEVPDVVLFIGRIISLFSSSSPSFPFVLVLYARSLRNA
jgi:hypothetical protein